MLGKLIKYELKATGRVFLPLYSIILIVAITHRLFGTSTGDVFGELSRIGELTTMALLVLFIALGIFTLVLTVQRFKKNLLEEEGYLMFTLPTTTRKLIGSKVIVALTWLILSSIVGITTFCILFVEKNFIKEVSILFESMFIDKTVMGFLATRIIWGLIMYIKALIVIYFSLSIGQFPKFQKHRSLISVVTFIITIISINWIDMFIVDTLNLSFESTLKLGIITTAIVSIILFEVTNFILTKHLNIE